MMCTHDHHKNYPWLQSHTGIKWSTWWFVVAELSLIHWRPSPEPPMDPPETLRDFLKHPCIASETL